MNRALPLVQGEFLKITRTVPLNISISRTPCRTPEPRSPVPPRGFEPIDKPNPCQTPGAPYLAPGTPYLAPGTPSLQYLPPHPPGNDRNGNLKSCGQIQCCLQILYLEQKLFEKVGLGYSAPYRFSTWSRNWLKR